MNPQQSDQVERDVDEAIWEEMETGLRHQGRITWNFVLLMALGGAICAVGLVSEPAPQAIAALPIEPGADAWQTGQAARLQVAIVAGRLVGAPGR